MPTVATQPSLQTTQAVGAALLHQFARERFLEAGVEESFIERAEREEEINSNPEQMHCMPTMADYGKELRKIADEFAKSRHRQILKEKAERVQLSDINRFTFQSLLEELFEGGITREKIVALFFFCTDVALRAVREAQGIVVKLLGWSFSYIIKTVCKKVYELGGWDDILFRQLPSFLMNCCAVLLAFGFGIYLHKSLKA